MNFYFTLLLTFILSHSAIGQNSRNEQLVKDVVLAFQEDFNEGGFKKAVFYTTKDWEHINPGGGITKGREAVLKEVRAVHQTFLKGVSLTIESMTIRFLTPTVAIADVVHKSSDYELPQGVKHQNERQMKTYVIVKRQNKWLLTLDQNTVIIGH
ncbi:SgcJ/EcaC family oxidoreductase [Ferruginibacter paludis]|uniref:SgcJ/EcaC family oxidoreductase n=1 Tax=Ferruginibacter paludis TaxID=1310417 RepID=UPI0025B607DD|nr:SgcJ/EcaC family oxidoreductase [Ferruginibacter paludis]MDN3657214.1 SgcJ/EcaC family oxidoreductase [Ferruginibacter paludis]